MSRSKSLESESESVVLNFLTLQSESESHEKNNNSASLIKTCLRASWSQWLLAYSCLRNTLAYLLTYLLSYLQNLSQNAAARLNSINIITPVPKEMHSPPVHFKLATLTFNQLQSLVTVSVMCPLLLYHFTDIFQSRTTKQPSLQPVRRQVCWCYCHQCRWHCCPGCPQLLQTLPHKLAVAVLPNPSNVPSAGDRPPHELTPAFLCQQMAPSQQLENWT